MPCAHTQTLWTFLPTHDVAGCPFPVDSEIQTTQQKFKSALLQRHFDDAQYTNMYEISRVTAEEEVKSLNSTNQYYRACSVPDDHINGPAIVPEKRQRVNINSFSVDPNRHLLENVSHVKTFSPPSMSYGLDLTRSSAATTNMFSHDDSFHEFGMNSLTSPALLQSPPISYAHHVDLDLSSSMPLATSSTSMADQSISKYHISTSIADQSISKYQDKPDSTEPDSSSAANVPSKTNYITNVIRSVLNTQTSTESSVDGDASGSSSEPLIAAKGEFKHNIMTEEVSGKKICQVCGDWAAGLYCGAFVCEACKKFYLRGQKLPLGTYTCTSTASPNNCTITKQTRTSCSYCRYRKCLAVGMHPPGCGLLDTTKVASMSCQVCAGSASGFHFGALTCECCKGFFRRSTKNKGKSYPFCTRLGKCPIVGVARSRDICRACRYQKCLSVGMSTTSGKIGRQPNSIRYARILEYHDGDRSKPVVGGEPKLEAAPPEDIRDVHADNKCSIDYNLTTLVSAYKALFKYLTEYKNPVTEDPCVTQTVFGREMMVCFLTNLHGLLTFIKAIPGFSKMNIEDRVKLTQRSVYPMLLFVYSQTYDLENGRFRYFNHSYEAGIKMVTFYPEYKPTWNHFKDLGRKIRSMDMNFIEQSLMLVLILVSSDDATTFLKDIGSVDALNMKLRHLLEQKIQDSYGVHVNRMGAVSLLLAELRLAALQHVQAARFFSQNHPDINVPEIYTEMFNKKLVGENLSQPSPR